MRGGPDGPAAFQKGPREREGEGGLEREREGGRVREREREGGRHRLALDNNGLMADV